MEKLEELVKKGLFFVSEEQIINQCWEISENSDCKKMHFGAILVRGNRILRIGYNHCVDESVKDLCEPECIRILENVKSGTRVELCTAIHAEQDAMENARENGNCDLSEAIMYVAGKYPFENGWKELIKDDIYFYCSFCSRAMARAGIKEVKMPLKEGNSFGVSGLGKEEYLRTSYEFAREIRKVFK